MSSAFDYQTAFARTVGWVTTAELQRLRTARVAIAGLGGVGGAHLLTLVRLGIGRFNIADPDIFELANMNRQVGATQSRLDRSKVEVMEAMARDINPELDITAFAQGVTSDNLDAFLADVDLYVDGLDFFAFDMRRRVFAACAERGIPAVTVAPLGMGAALLNFDPAGMSFDQYFDLRDGLDDEDLALRFMVGLAPAMLQMGYLADPDTVDLAAQRGPSTPMACDLCAGVAGTEALRILLERGRVTWAPRGVHYDAYRQRLARTWRPGGNRNPLQRLVLAVARRRLARLGDQRPRPASANKRTD
ncbi:ThiF family adenylyltransferase [Thioalkalivibrio sp. ALJ16]|uniref:ThiF family adenylyltransferase n=1 Tax=Thioalkalivibrio sp. ALJ16 TaxID=1158762 RepID=UPI000369F455|nr:ThiF family adenylyltransferase [Thioalkalivibrio sp. ALJ16]